MREGNSLELFFESSADREYFLYQAFTPDLKAHTITFADPDFVPIWLAEVGPVMQAARAVDYELYVVGGCVRFSTQSPETYALFGMFEEQGMFNGPDGGCAIWKPTSRERVYEAFDKLDCLQKEPPTGRATVMTRSGTTGDLPYLEMLMQRVKDRTCRNESLWEHDCEHS